MTPEHHTNHRTIPDIQPRVSRTDYPEVEEPNGWKDRAEKLELDVSELSSKLSVKFKDEKTKIDTAHELCKQSIVMIQRLQEITNHKDFRTAMAVSAAQGFTYEGPWIKDEANALGKSIQEFQKVWGADPSQQTQVK